MTAQLVYDNIESVCKFPVESPRDVAPAELAHYLRDATRDARNAKAILRRLWHELPERDRLWWHEFAMGPKDGNRASERDKHLAYEVMVVYPEVVSEFINARSELRDVIARLRSKDVWGEALSDATFVDAAKRGTAAIKAGRVTKVAWDKL